MGSIMKTQGEIEAAICDGVSRPSNRNSWAVARKTSAGPTFSAISWWCAMQGVLTAAEQHLVRTLVAEKGRRACQASADSTH